ncbi:GntR family transcriptional regulator [Donghicola sp. C2-DW-16]|uniref:GntR family transcriptional regulator n=1 Tax=Donghicola mangrovi TaxID=2729614 RepID=A0ABX2PDX0_9RHOB|nr:GntR family transcriptional regulator [Donghicola mangrovi]NVO27331.1 GntR family transcriptional regulator [Donghicola mangrovi]
MLHSQGQPPLRAVSIAATLEAEIITGTIPGGTKLDEQSLSQRFDVSRTPVREALHLLAARSLVERVPYRGVVVLEITRERIEQMFETMAEVEALCARFAAERMTLGERATLQSMHQTMQALAVAGDTGAYETANTEFHQMIYRGTHNTDMFELAEGMRIKLSAFRRNQLKSVSRMEQSNGEHDGIVTAIVDRKPAEAETALRRHLLSAAQEVLSRIG